MWFGWEIVFDTFPNCSFVNGDGITQGVPIVVNCKSVLQGGIVAGFAHPTPPQEGIIRETPKSTQPSPKAKL